MAWIWQKKHRLQHSTYFNIWLKHNWTRVAKSVGQLEMPMWWISRGPTETRFTQRCEDGRTGRYLMIYDMVDIWYHLFLPHVRFLEPIGVKEVCSACPVCIPTRIRRQCHSVLYKRTWDAAKQWTDPKDIDRSIWIWTVVDSVLLRINGACGLFIDKFDDW